MGSKGTMGPVKQQSELKVSARSKLHPDILIKKKSVRNSVATILHADCRSEKHSIVQFYCSILY